MNHTNLQKPNLTDTNQKILREIHQLARTMDSAFEVPVIRKSFGIDAVAGLFPGFGDFITILPSLYIVWRAKSMDIPKEKLIEMLGNIIVDTATGSIPIMGDFFDFFWKSNIKNINIIHDHFGLPSYKQNREQSNLFSPSSDLVTEPQEIEPRELKPSILSFEQWLDSNPVLQNFTLEEQKEGYQNYLSSHHS
jgi:hypothetical protein